MMTEEMRKKGGRKNNAEMNDGMSFDIGKYMLKSYCNCKIGKHCASEKVEFEILNNHETDGVVTINGVISSDQNSVNSRTKPSSKMLPVHQHIVQTHQSGTVCCCELVKIICERC